MPALATAERRAAAAGIVAFAVTFVAAHLRSTPYNNYVLLADALLHGRTWIDWPGPYIDALGYNGHRYVIEGPLPAVLLLPFVLIFGTHANQTLLAVMLAAIAVGAAWNLAEKLGAAPRDAAWLCAFLLAGTDLLWCAMLGDVWFVAHVSAVCFTMLALCEVMGKSRGWLVGLFAACAAESRFVMALALPIYAYLIALREHHNPAARRSALAGFGLTLLPIAALWIAYNEARWGTIADIGYTAWFHQDAAGMPTGSPFQWSFLPYELESFFVQGPSFIAGFPWLRPEFSGIALTWTSPALILALRARGYPALVAALALAALLTAIPNLLYYVNGFAQFGMRHALDFEPFLFGLMAIGVRKGMPLWGKALCAYSIAVGLWGTWYWNAFYRA